jgi:hypothetical protein
MGLDVVFVAKGSQDVYAVTVDTSSGAPAPGSPVKVGHSGQWCHVAAGIHGSTVSLITAMRNPDSWFNVRAQVSGSPGSYSGTADVVVGGGSVGSLISFGGRVFLTLGGGGNVDVLTSADGINWEAPGTIPIANAFGASLATLNGKLCCVASTAAGARLACAVSSDGISWSNPITIPDRYTRGTANVVEYKGRLVMAYVAANDGNEILIAYSDDCINWYDQVVIGQQSTCAPSLAVDENNRLWMAYAANNPSRDVLLTSSTNGYDFEGSPSIGSQANTYDNAQKTKWQVVSLTRR